MVKQPCDMHYPERSAECHAICEKWKAYEQARNAEYERVAQVKKQVYDLNEIEKKRKRDLATGKMRTRRWKRNG